MEKRKICLITFSNNADHQNVVYSMFLALKDNTNIYTIGINNPKSGIALHTDRNFYFDCPLRPGIEKKTFNFPLLLKIAKVIKKEKIHYLYFESMHIWNALLMLLCPQCIKIVAVHDVIPHDGNKAMVLCNYVTCHMANHIILRNYKYKETLAEKYKLDINKITCFELWRFYPPKDNITYNKKMLCFGRIRKYKGFDLLEDIVRKTPSAKYQIVGEPDEESKQIVSKLETYPNVTMEAREVSDEEMAEYFHNADWIILPYSEATQSGVITDAYKFSRPVIAFNVGAISEQIENGKTGFLVPKKDTKAFAQAVDKALQMTKEETEEFANAAYKYGYNKYSADVVSKQFLKIIYTCTK